MITNLNHIRQTSLIDPAKLDFNVGMVGAGGIGSWTALALLKMGLQHLTVYDYDIVEEPNLGSQLYSEVDIDQPKVTRLAERLDILTGITLEPRQLKIENVEQLEDHQMIISAVDNMATRQLLFDGLQGQDKLFIDARMAGNVIQIFTVKLDNADQITKYQQTLFSDSEATPIACSARAVVYNTFIIAGLIADLIAKYANGQSLPAEIEVDLTNLTLYKD